MNYINGIRIQESVNAHTLEPNRKHCKRRNQSRAYHRRVQKKWTKRFGTHVVPAAYLLGGAGISGDQQVFVMHPILAARLRREVV